MVEQNCDEKKLMSLIAGMEYGMDGECTQNS